MGDPTAVATTKGLKELSSAERFAIMKRLDDVLEKDGVQTPVMIETEPSA